MIRWNSHKHQSLSIDPNFHLRESRRASAICGRKEKNRKANEVDGLRITVTNSAGMYKSDKNSR